MKPSRKTQLLEELEYLEKLIQTHIDYKAIIWKDREEEFEEHLNAMLDYYNQIREALNQLDI